VQYFIHNEAILCKDRNYGLRYLVSKAVHRNGSDSQMQSLTEEHIKFHSNIALLSSRLTPAEKEYLVAGFDSLAKLAKSGYKVDEALVPVTNNVLNQRYLKNKNSFMQIIPKPEVKTMARHGYVSVKSCVADFLARHDFIFDELIDAKSICIRRISQCRQAQEMLESVKSSSKNWMEPERKRLILYLIEWSDDFDPAKSIKDNRGSAWIKSITISPLHFSREKFSATQILSQ